MRRFAIFSDIHGNLLALEAVLSDIAETGVAETYCLGDLVGYGAQPAEVVDRVRDAHIPTVRGNYDDGVGARRGSCGCYYATAEAREDGEASYAWTDGALDEADHQWLATLPDDIRFDAEGLRVLLAHGSPRKINEYLMSDRTDEQLARLAHEAQADLVCVGHVHIPYHRTMHAENGARIDYVNAGSVGKSKDGDPRACWVEVLVDGSNVTAVVHRVDYDVEAAANAIVEAGLPARLAHALRSA
jgi:predicted phosphodiesterase